MKQREPWPGLPARTLHRLPSGGRSRAESQGSAKAGFVSVLVVAEGTETLGLLRGADAPSMDLRVSRATGLVEALRLLEAVSFDVVLTELGLPDSEGIDTYRALLRAVDGVPIIVLATRDEVHLARAALKEGAQDYLVKGVDTEHATERALRQAMAHKALDEQLLHAQRLAALGQLAVGVAHDFNNVLTIIQANASLLHASATANEVSERVAEISGAAERASELARQLLTFGRPRTKRPRQLDLNEVVLGVSGMLRQIMGDVHIELGLSADIALVDANRGMVEQVLLNLSINAYHALPRQGTLTIETRPVSLTPEAACELHAMAHAGEHVCLVVRDNGSGIESAILERIWEPFFTTKGPDKGTGLGLPMVQRIVAQHGGFIRVQSVLGTGTVFEVFLPASMHPACRDLPSRAAR